MDYFEFLALYGYEDSKLAYINFLMDIYDYTEAEAEREAARYY